MPCSDSLYFLFVNYGTLPRLWYYFEINVNSYSGQGSISAGPFLFDSSAVSAADICRHPNNKDFWLITRGSNNQEFKAWLISDTGVAVAPFVSTVQGASPGGGYIEFMDISPDASLIALTSRWSPYANLNNALVRLYKFDDQVGTITDYLQFNKSNLSEPTGNNTPCFSPSGSMLYVSAVSSFWQFDLTSNDSSTIVNSGINIFSGSSVSPYYLYDIQPAVDGKLYVSRGPWGSSTTYMAVINNPNDTGSACNFTLDGFDCHQKSVRGLPKPIHNLYVHRIIQRDSLECIDDTTTFYFDNYAYFDSAQWFIDTGAAQVLLSSDSLAHYVFDSAGVYPIMAVSYSGCRLDTFYDTVTVLLTPAPNLGPDTILCEGDTIAIQNDWMYSYLWSTGDTTQGIRILQPDTYWLELSNYCGVARDTVVVDSIIQALVVFPTDDTLLCDGDVLHLSAEVDAGTYSWFDGSTDSVNNITASDTVWATAENACGTSSDTIRVRFTDVPELPILKNVLCLGDTYIIDLETDSLSTFLWYNGDTTSFDSITSQAHYWVKETNLCGTDSDTFLVAFVTDPVVNIGPDTVICIEDVLVLDASTSFGSYVWQDGSTDSNFVLSDSLLVPGSNYFHVTVTNVCSSDIDSIFVEVDLPLDIHLGPDLVFCAGEVVTLDAGYFDRTTYKWKGLPAGFSGTDPSVTFELTEAMSPMEASVALTNACGTFRDSVVVYVDAELAPDLGPDLELCHGDSVVLNAGYRIRTTYTWSGLPPELGTVTSHNIAFQTIKAHSPIEVSVSAENACGDASSSILIVIDSLPRLSGLDTIFFCQGESVSFTISNPTIDHLEWYDGSTSFGRIIDEEVTWHLTYFNRCGKTYDTLPSIEVEPPVFRYTSPQLLCEHVLTLEPAFYAPENDNYYPVFFVWNNQQQMPWNDVTEIGVYTVTATNSKGCMDSASVQVKTCGPDFFTANSFTPNGDPFNPFWKPVGEGLYAFTCVIYDRWGNLIFTFDELSQGWDGTINGQPAPTGVYHWHMEVQSEDFTENNRFEGHVTLVR